MNHVVLGLGIVLAAAGCVSIFFGYDIIEIERGWTEVIAGTTALSGGIVTIGLALVMRQMKLLGQLFLSAQAIPIEVPILAPASPFAATMAEQQAFAAPEPRAPEPHAIETRYAAPVAPAFAAPALGLHVLAQEAALLTDEAPAPHSHNYEAADREIEQLTAALALETVSKASIPEAPPAAPEVPAETPESRFKFNRFLRGRSGQNTQTMQSAPAMETAVIPAAEPFADNHFEDTLPAAQDLDLPRPEDAAQAQEPRLSAASLAFDELWQRVTGEIDRPVLPHAAQEPPTLQASPVEETLALMPHEEIEEAPMHFDDEAVPRPVEPMAEAVIDENLPKHDFDAASDPDHFGFEHGHESLDAAASTHDLPMPSWEKSAAEQHHYHDEELSLMQSPDVPAPFAAAAEPYAAPTPVDPPLIAPAVIGRYEAEGTAYLMFADGSIEAQSEAGIFHFASMADLKAFIENKQTADT